MKYYMANQGKLDEITQYDSDPIFSKGDAYIVIDEKRKNIWIWLGTTCSVDEKATVAREAKTINVENYNRGMKIRTVDQDEEPKEFIGMFHSFRVLNKNLAETMLKDVTTSTWAGHIDHVDVLYRVSSEEYESIDHMKYVQVDFVKKSLDSDDCFVADLGDFIWIWQGKESNVKEKVKANKFAREFNATRGGHQKVTIFMEGDDDEEFMQLFEGKFPKGKVFLDYDPENGVMRERPADTKHRARIDKPVSSSSKKDSKGESKGFLAKLFAKLFGK